MRILIYKKNKLIGTSGGIEKVISWFSGALSKQGHEVFVVTRDVQKGDLFYPLLPEVKFQQLPIVFPKWRKLIGKVFKQILPYFNQDAYVQKAINQYFSIIQPDVIIATGVSDFIDVCKYAGRGHICKKFIQIHNNPKTALKKRKKKLYQRLFQYADGIQVLLPSFVSAVRTYYSGQISVIGNTVLKNDIQTVRQNIIIYVGRVEPSKRQHLLIEAFAQIHLKYPDWKVHFWGEINVMDYYQKCVSLIQQHDLKECVLFKGRTQQMPQELVKASICAFPSAVEGFSLALTEAMAAGLPCVGFKDIESVNELIHHNHNGLLATDAMDFVDCLEKLIVNDNLRIQLGENARIISEQYSSDKILNAWLNLIEK